MSKKSLLIVLLAITGCDILSSSTEKPPFIEYKEGHTSQYEYKLSILYPDSSEFVQVDYQLLTTVVKSTDDEIVVNDSLLSGLTKMQITVDDERVYPRDHSTWYRYDDGFFTQHAYTRPLGYLVLPKVLKNGTQILHVSNTSLLKKLSPERMITGIFNIENFETDSIRLRDDPRLVHPRDFKLGKKWTAFSDPWLSESTITDEKELVINDSLYSSYEIVTENFLESSEFTLRSYFDSHGLIKRVIVLDLTFTDELGEPVGEGVTRSVVRRLQFNE